MCMPTSCGMEVELTSEAVSNELAQWYGIGPYMCPTRGSSFFFGKVTALGVLCCFALLFV